MRHSIPYIIPLSTRHFSELERDLSSIDDPNSVILWIWKYSNRLSSVTNIFNSAFESSKILAYQDKIVPVHVMKANEWRYKSIHS